MTTHPTLPPRGSLSEAHIRQITRALETIGEYGEVRLIKEKGRLRFIQTVTSEAACDAGRAAAGETPATGHPYAQTRR